MTSHDHIHQLRLTPRPAAPVGLPDRRTALLVGLVAWAVVVGFTQSLAVSGLALVPATLAAAADVRARTVPGRWVAATASVALAGAAIVGGTHGLVAAIVGAAAAGLPHLAVHVAEPCRLGFGDVELASALGLLVGPTAASTGEQLALVMTFVSTAAAVGLAMAVATGRRAVPYAPALVFAAAVVLVIADRGGTVAA